MLDDVTWRLFTLYHHLYAPFRAESICLQVIHPSSSSQAEEEQPLTGVATNVAPPEQISAAPSAGRLKRVGLVGVLICRN